jgi:hypothetical protein
MFSKKDRRRKARSISRRGVVATFGSDAGEVVFFTATINRRGEESLTTGFFVDPSASDAVDRAMNQIYDYLKAHRVDEIAIIDGIRSVRDAFCGCCGELGHPQVE